MSRLPSVSGRQCVKALEKVGFTVRRRTGSHLIAQRGDPYAQIVVPNHRTLKHGLLRKIIKDAGLTVEEFVELL
ncbi:MAG: type II toxin-antitoxin system HicA family toxin [Anaerolineae bacterium]|nr:type II toxin-antitoxin system HicA family toxin [Anaerolineae bacterium]